MFKEEWNSGTLEYDIVAQRISSGGEWLPGSTAFSSKGFLIHAISDGNGGVIAVTMTDPLGPRIGRLILYRIDSNGAIVWGPLQINSDVSHWEQTHIARIGQDSVVLAWMDTVGQEKFRVCMAKVGVSGSVQWVEEVSREGGNRLDVVPDGLGNALVTYDRRVYEPAFGDYYSHVFIQKVSSAGANTWGVDGIELDDSGTEDYSGDPRLVTDGDGGAFVVWANSWPTGLLEGQCVDRNGVKRWGTSHLITPTGAYHGGYGSYSQKIVEDVPSTAVIGWHGGIEGTGSGVFAQRVSKSTFPTTTFYFAEGTCRPNFEPYFCIQNPGTADASVTITYMKGDGTTDTQDVGVPKNSRVTVSAKDKLGVGDDAAHDFSAKVECTNGQTIIAERPMYFNYNGVWTGGHDVVGFIP